MENKKKKLRPKNQREKWQGKGVVKQTKARDEETERYKVFEWEKVEGKEKFNESIL